MSVSTYLTRQRYVQHPTLEEEQMTREPVNKQSSEDSFKNRATKTMAINLAKPLRGGWRL